MRNAVGHWLSRSRSKKNVYKYYKNNIKLKQKCVVLNQNIKADP